MPISQSERAAQFKAADERRERERVEREAEQARQDAARLEREAERERRRLAIEHAARALLIATHEFSESPFEAGRALGIEFARVGRRESPWGEGIFALVEVAAQTAAMNP